MYPGKDELTNAMNLLASGQVKEARDKLRHIVKRRPGILLAWKTLADIAENPKERSNAIRRAQLLAPGDSWVIEAKKHRMPPKNAPHAHPPTTGPYAVVLPEPEPDPATTSTMEHAGTQPIRPASSLELTRPIAAARPSEPPVVSPDEATIERPLSEAERAELYGDTPPPRPAVPESSEPVTPPKPASWLDPAERTDTIPPAPGDSSADEEGAGSQDPFDVDPEVTIRTPTLKSSAMQRALDRYSEGLADEPLPAGVMPESTPTAPKLTAVPKDSSTATPSHTKDNRDSISQKDPGQPGEGDFDAEALIGTDGMQVFSDDAQVYTDQTVASAAIAADDDEENAAIEPWMLMLVVAFGVMGCVMLFVAFFTSGIMGGG